MRVAIVGGGYAGMAVLVSLRQMLPDVELHLIDPALHHLKVTHLQQTLHRPLAECRVAFADLARRFNFTHHRLALSFDMAKLIAWQRDKVIELDSGALGFDYLVIATGAKPKPRSWTEDECVYDQESFRRLEGRQIIAHYLRRTRNMERFVSVVGAGASGLQFLFELHSLFAAQNIDCRLRLIDNREKLLLYLPGSFDRYLRQRLRTLGIDYLSSTRCLEQKGDHISVEEMMSGREYQLPSSLTLVFPGVTPYPYSLEVNRYGRLKTAGRLLWNVFAAGDCAQFAGSGLNALSAQAAVRKGKQVATNIRRIHQGRWPLFYTYAEQGFLVSLGPWNGIGWLLFKQNRITGLPAFIAKEAVEKQWDLFLEGVDTYF